MVTGEPSCPAARYYWRVAASNSCGQGPWSLVRSYTVRQISAAPVLISPGDGRFTCQSRAVFHWHPEAMATSYSLEVDTDLSLASPQLGADRHRALLLARGRPGSRHLRVARDRRERMRAGSHGRHLDL